MFSSHFPPAFLIVAALVGVITYDCVYAFVCLLAKWLTRQCMDFIENLRKQIIGCTISVAINLSQDGRHSQLNIRNVCMSVSFTGTELQFGEVLE